MSCLKQIITHTLFLYIKEEKLSNQFFIF